ncbi:response regulator transcription factor [Roseateles sp.]|uniref:response regulator transcription factor n=1 Tax=Roseateles sp. TaxID=1971397 RepID=UPI002F3E5BBC
MIQVLVVDDHTIFRSGLTRLLQDEPDMRVVAEAQNGGEALELVRSLPFDAVLLDINMEGRSGLEVLASMQALPRCPPVLMLSMYPEAQYALVAVQAGASGYLAKDSEPAELVRAIRTVAGGKQYLSARVSGQVQDQLRGLDARPAHERLSVREHQIMLMTLRGMSVTEIAGEMMVSVKTVSTHRTNLLTKLGLGSTAELVLYAVRQGLVH